MRSSRPSPEHQAAVARRLALLSAELGRVRAEDDGQNDDPDDPNHPDHPDDLPPLVATPLLLAPGRHAARRAGPALRDVVPAPLRGTVALGSAHVAVVAVLVALGLALTCWWVLRGRPAVVPAPTLSEQGAAPVAGLVSAPAASATPGSITVDVAGRVRRSGIAVLDVGSRVVDALRAAGGARRGVDLSGLNLARVLVDGEQVVVGGPPPAGVAASSLPPTGATPGPLVNLNTATQAELESLPEVGPVTAGSIIAWRDEHGGFTAVDELLEVNGIGEVTLGRIAPHVTV